MRTGMAAASHGQPGDPAKLAAALMTMVDDPAPPLRMPFGSDTVAAIEARNAFVAAELATWRDLSVSTHFSTGSAAAA